MNASVTTPVIGSMNGLGFVWAQYTSSLPNWSTIISGCTVHGPSSDEEEAVAMPHPVLALYGAVTGPGIFRV